METNSLLTLDAGNDGISRAFRFVANTLKSERFLVVGDENGWIPIFEKRPDPARPVLVFNGHWIGVGKQMPLVNDGRMEELDRWETDTGEYIERSGPRVTHWMPLPEPPK